MLHQRYVVLSFIVLAILMGAAVQAAAGSAVVELGFEDVRVGGLINATSLAAIGTALLSFIVMIRSVTIVQFTDECVDELSKVTWPSREETVRASTTVVFTTLLVAALLGLYDLLWKNVADVVLFTGGQG